MAVLFVTEFERMGVAVIGGDQSQLPMMPPLAEQTVAIGGGSVQSSAFNAKTSFIRVHTDAICSIAIGTSPTASATTMRFAAGQTEYLAVGPAQKIAVITNV